MILTARERRRLKSLGQTRADDLHVGKAGVTDGVLDALRTMIQRKELIKVRFDDLEGDARRAFAAELAAALDAACIAVVGRTALLYRDNPDLEPAKRVLTP